MSKKKNKSYQHVRVFYYDIQEHQDKSIRDLESMGYRLMEESGDLIDIRIIQGIKSLIVRTETDIEYGGTGEEESCFLVIPMVCVHKLIKTSDGEEIDLGGGL